MQAKNMAIHAQGWWAFAGARMEDIRVAERRGDRLEGCRLAEHDGIDGGAAAIEAGRVLLAVGMARREHALAALRVVRAHPRVVVRVEVCVKLRLHTARRSLVQEQRALVERMRGPPRVLLAPAVALNQKRA